MRPLLPAVLSTLALASASAADQCATTKPPLVKETQLRQDGPDLFGVSLAVGKDLDGKNLVLVGAPGGANVAGAKDMGAAYLFEGTSLTQTLSDHQQGSRFGWSVALSGDGNTLAVGAPLHNEKGTSAGAVWVFARNGGEPTKVTGRDTTAFDAFGFAIALDETGQTLVVGAPLHDLTDGRGNAGAVYVFERREGSWIQTKELTANDAERDDQLGTSVAIDGGANTIAAGAPQPEPGVQGDNTTGKPGKVYIFERSEGSWAEATQDKLTTESGKGFDAFGFAVALEPKGDTLVVGAPGRGTRAGGAFLFRRSQGSWQANLLCLIDVGAELGFAVSIDGSTVAIGARKEGSDKGAVYVFDGDTLLGKLTASSSTASEFGRAVAVRDGRLAVGAPLSGNNDEGAAFVYELTGLLFAKALSLEGSVPGEPSVFKATVVNGTNNELTNLPVTLSFDLQKLENVTVTCEGATCCSNGCPSLGGKVDDTVALPPGGQATYTLRGDILSDATQKLTNEISVGKPDNSSDLFLADNRDSLTVNLTPEADLIIASIDAQVIPETARAAGNGLTAVPGSKDNVKYTFQVRNEGPSDAPKALVKDTFPEGLKDIKWRCRVVRSASCKHKDQGTTVQSANGVGNIEEIVDLMSDGELVYEVESFVRSAARGKLVNQVSVTRPSGHLGNNDAKDAPEIVLMPKADLAIEMVPDPAPPADAIPGKDRVTYTLTVTNNGPSNITEAKVTFSVSGGPFDDVKWHCQPEGRARCTAHGTGSPSFNDTISVPAERKVTYTIDGSVNAAAVELAAKGSVAITQEDAAELPGDSNDTGDVAVKLAPQADLGVTICVVDDLKQCVSKPEAIPGKSEGAIFKIVAVNYGPSDVTSASLIGRFPSITVTQVSCEFTEGAVCGLGNVSNPLLESVALAHLASVTYYVTGMIASSATGTLNPEASITAEGPPGISEEGNKPNRASLPLQLTPMANLSVKITDFPKTAVPGSPNEVSYKIMVANDGPSDAPGTKVEFRLTTGLSEIQWMCGTSDPLKASCQNMTGTGEIDQTVNLLKGGSLTYTATGVVELNSGETPPESIRGTATVTLPEGIHDPDDGDMKTVTVTTLITPESDLAVKLEVIGNAPVRGDMVTYKLTVTNNGPSNANLVKVEDRLPALFKLQSIEKFDCSSSGSQTSLGSGDLSDVIDNGIPPRQSACYELKGTVKNDPSLFPGPLFNLASATLFDARDPDLGNNSDLESHALEDDPSLTGAMSVSGHFVPGGEIVYRVVLANNTDTDILSITFRDKLPTQLTLKYAGATAGSVTQVPDPAGDMVTWSGDIQEMDTIEIVIFAEIRSNASTPIENQGKLFMNGSSTPDACTHNPYQTGNNTQTCFTLEGNSSPCPTPDPNAACM